MINKADFILEQDLIDGKKLFIALTNASLAEHLILKKLAKHAIEVVNFYKRLENQSFVNKFIRESMERLKKDRCL